MDQLTTVAAREYLDAYASGFLITAGDTDRRFQPLANALQIKVVELRDNAAVRVPMKRELKDTPDPRNRSVAPRAGIDIAKHDGASGVAWIDLQVLIEALLAISMLRRKPISRKELRWRLDLRHEDHFGKDLPLHGCRYIRITIGMDF